MTETETKLIALVARKFEKESGSLKASDDFFEKLRIDSIQALSLLSELEMAFDVEIPDYELQDVKTFSALAALVDKRK